MHAPYYPIVRYLLIFFTICIKYLCNGRIFTINPDGARTPPGLTHYHNVSKPPTGNRRRFSTRHRRIALSQHCRPERRCVLMSERTTIEFDEDLKQAIDDHDMTMRDIVHKAVRGMLGQADLDTEYLLEARIEELEKEIAHWESKEQEAREKKQSKQQELEILQKKLEETREESNSYEDDLDTVLDEMVESGQNVFVEHPDVKELSRTHERDPEAVISDLKSRSDARELPLDETRFEQQMSNDYASPEAAGGAF